MKPEDICKVDYDGKQLAGTRKRTSEVLLHLAVYKNRPDVKAVVHCHPPHATAFAVAHEPIPKCVLPEVEVFLGEVPIAMYETPGDQKFADTIVPYVKDVQHDHPRQPRHRDLRPRPGEGLLQHRDHRRLLQDPDPGQAAGPRQLLHASSRRRSCWTSRSGSATTTCASTTRLRDVRPQQLRRGLPTSCREPTPSSRAAPVGDAAGAERTRRGERWTWRAGAIDHRSGHGGAGRRRR